MGPCVGWSMCGVGDHPLSSLDGGLLVLQHIVCNRSRTWFNCSCWLESTFDTEFSGSFQLSSRARTRFNVVKGRDGQWLVSGKSQLLE